MVICYRVLFKCVLKVLMLSLGIAFLHGLVYGQGKENSNSFPQESAQAVDHATMSGQNPVNKPESEIENEATLIEEQQPSFYIKHIMLQGARFLSKRARKRILSPYLYTYLNAQKIGKLVQTIQAYYILQGYPTTQVKVVLGQNLQAGYLKLVVNLGFIEEIIHNGHTPRDKGKVATAFPFFRGKPLYLPYLENGIDQINTVPSSNATLKILPGLQEGGSVILIDNVIHNPVRFDIGIDNTGEKECGEWTWNYNLALDNLLSINDKLMVNYSINQAKVVGTTKLRLYSLTFNYNFPISYFNFSISHGINSSVKSYEATKYQSFYTTKSYNQNYEVKFPIYKYRLYKGTILCQVKYNVSDNRLRDAPMKNQNAPQTQLKASMAHTGLLLKGQYHLSIAYERGVPWFGAEIDKQQPEPGVEASNMPKRQVGKIDIYGMWMRPFAFFKYLFNYQVEVVGQYSKSEVVGLGQFPLTGRGQVRGFEEDYRGSKGIYCKQELSFMHLFSFTKWLYPLQFIASLDIGYMPKVSNTAIEHKNMSITLMSYNLGFHYDIKWLGINFAYAKPLYSTKHWNISHKTYQIYVSCSCKIHEFFVKEKKPV